MTAAEATSIFETMQAEVLSKDDGRATVRFPVNPAHMIPGNRLQGGILGVMMDMAMAVAADGAISTVSVQYTILRPAMGSHLIVNAEVVRKGRRIVYAEAETRDEEDRLVARGNQSAVPLDLGSD